MKATPSSARFVIVTLDAHLAGAVARARKLLRRDGPAIDLRVHVAADWANDAASLARCQRDLETAHFAIVTQLFVEEHIAAVQPVLSAHRDRYDAIASMICAPELMRLTRLGRFSMGGEASAASPWSPTSVIRRLLGGRRNVDGKPESSGERQMRSLRNVPRILRFVPGTAQDVRAYYLLMQYWLAGSDANIASLVRFVVSRYGRDGRESLVNAKRVDAPVSYPDVGLYHPALPGSHVADSCAALDRALPDGRARATRPRVGVLLMRSYVLSGNTAHYDAVIRALEARGLAAVPAFAGGLDGRPAIERFFRGLEGDASIDVLISLTGFSLVGGPAYNDASAAQKLLASLDVPYLSLQSLEFQTVEQWRGDVRGLSPLQATLQVAIPELDGATVPMVFGGRVGTAASDGDATTGDGASAPITDRVDRLADRVAALVRLRREARASRRIAIVLFNFPPNAGSVGTAAYLAVFESVYRTLHALRSSGYSVDIPASADALREQILGGNAERYGMPANVVATISADDHVRQEPHLAEIEKAWGPAPGKAQSDGRSLFVLGARFGNVVVGVQPPFGYEGDPMRLLFERGFAPTHAFSAFYRWLRRDFGAHAVVHFGTHGALEFMPGKQVGLTGDCWPDRLIGDLPNIYVYAANNPSEGTLAKRRGSATLVSYLTPSITNAGLYRDLAALKAAVDRWRSLDEHVADDDRHELSDDIQARAAALELASPSPRWNGDAGVQVGRVREQLLELEQSLIPTGLHVLGQPMDADARTETLLAIVRAGQVEPSAAGDANYVEAFRQAFATDGSIRRGVDSLVRHRDRAELRQALTAIATSDAASTTADEISRVAEQLAESPELDALTRALDARYISPAPGGDLLRNPAILPTGRNVYGFDPYHVPSAGAMREGARQADRLLARHVLDGHPLPQSVAIVLWGTDNMKSDGASLAMALALMGAAPRFDSLGRLAGAQLTPLDALGRPRIDVVITASGIFRDLFPLQMRLLAEAALLASRAEEPTEMNLVRAHTLAHQQALGCTFDDAALRIFSNAEGAYGANVNLLVDSSTWSDGAELGEAFMRRKSFAYGMAGATARPELLERALADASLAYQQLDGIETGATDIDQYFDSLGAMSGMIRRKNADAPVYLGDMAVGSGTVRTLNEQVALETRTRMLNPKWYEAMLRNGFEGARVISSHATNTLGWSATAGGIPQWVYRDIATTYVLDESMRRRLATLNPHAAAQLGARLLEATDRGFWEPDDATLDALRDATAELEDWVEGVHATT